jgi:hypothetical protein
MSSTAESEVFARKFSVRTFPEQKTPLFNGKNKLVLLFTGNGTPESLMR